jgi:hypothetical protein
MKNQEGFSHSKLNNRNGFASIEAISMITIFLLLISYTYGFFGVIHSSILHSIAARNYAFETFRNRTNLTYFRIEAQEQYRKNGLRFHAVTSKYQNIGSGFWASARPIAIGRTPGELNRKNSDMHNIKVPSLRTGVRNQRTEVSPVWIKSRYGICLNNNCGDG